jgi:predicted nuclease of restriction endonuclease-like (RecB) superfamily
MDIDSDLPQPSPLPESTELFLFLRTLVSTATDNEGPYARFALVEAYWNIGRIIVEIELKGQERADYGIHVIEALSDQLTITFGKGYSLPNMWRFKQFFLAFRILSTKGREFEMLRKQLRRELKWSHYRFLTKIKDEKERSFYMNQAADEGWTVRFLQRMVQLDYYDKVALSGTELMPTQTSGISSSPTLSVVGGASRTRLANLKKMLLEKFVGYAFVGQRQYISISGQDKWIELVFFHFVVNRFVLIQFGEHNPIIIAQFIEILNAYEQKQPPATSKLPIGFLINSNGVNKLLTTQFEATLSEEESANFPLSFS